MSFQTADETHDSETRHDSLGLPMHGAREEESTQRRDDEVVQDADTASSVDHIAEKKQEVVLTKREKFKRHCGRFKLWYLVGFLIFLVIFLPILFKVIIPAVVQHIVNGQSLPIKSGSLRAVSPTELAIDLKTSLDTPLAAYIDPVSLNLYNKDTQEYSPFVKLNLEGQHVHHNTEVVVPDQRVKVLNENELSKWFSQVFDQPKVNLSLKADPKPKIKLGALEYRPKMDLTIEVPALNSLEGFQIADLQFMKDHANGHNMKGHLNLPNSGALTLGLGNLTFNMVTGGIKLGIVNVYSAELKPGNNSLAFDGTFYFDQLIPNLAIILESQVGALATGTIELNATGNATVVNGQHIPYIEKVLKTKTLSARVPILTLMGDVLSGALKVDSSGGSVVNTVGDVFGNSSLLEQTYSHWGGKSKDKDNSSKLKRGNMKVAMVKNMLKLKAREMKF